LSLLSHNALSFGPQGDYESMPEIILGFDKPYSEQEKVAIMRMKWHLDLSDSYISVDMNNGQDPIKMSYTMQGDYILAIEFVNGVARYEAFYIDSNGQLHGMGTIFRRVTTR
jgi:hypothetical protein